MLKRFCDKCGTDITSLLDYWKMSLVRVDDNSTITKELCPDCKVRVLQIITDND